MIVRRSLSKKQLMLRQRLACNCNLSYMRWISAVYVATDLLISLWPSLRAFLPETCISIPSKNRYRHRSYSTFCLLEAAKHSIKKLKKRLKIFDIWINGGTKVGRTLAPPLLLALTLELGKICPESCTSTIAKKSTIRGIALSLEKIWQKTSIYFCNIYHNNWY